MTDTRSITHLIMATRLRQLRIEFEAMSATAAQSRGLSGWLFRRAVRNMMRVIEDLETGMREEAGRSFCPHGIHLDHCTMPTCIEAKVGSHYRARKEAMKAARAEEMHPQYDN